MIFKVDIKQFKELSMLFRGVFFWSGCYKVAILLTILSVPFAIVCLGISFIK